MNLTHHQQAALRSILTSDQSNRNYHGASELAALHIIWYTDGLWRVTGYGAAQAALHGLPHTHRIVPQPSSTRQVSHGGNPNADKRVIS